MSYKEESSDDDDIDFNSVESSFNQTIEEDNSVDAERQRYRNRSLVAEVTDRLSKLSGFEKPNPDVEVVEEGFVAGLPVGGDVRVQPEPRIMVNYDEENGEDAPASAMQDACRSVARIEFDQTDLNFFFKQVEIKMKSSGVKKQFTKMEVLTTILPKKVIDEVKPILLKDEDQFPENDSYKQLKKEIIRIFGPGEGAAFERAFGRVLSGKPSQLARAIVNDMCPHQLTGCCCAKWVQGLWLRQLPVSTRQAIASIPFTAENFADICKKADENYAQSHPHAVTQIAAVTAAPVPQNQYVQPSLPPTAQLFSPQDSFHQGWQDVNGQQEVAAVSYQAWRSRGRGQFRGNGRNRGFRGNRGGGNRGASSGGSGGSQYSASNPRHKGPRHADQPPFEACKKHWDWGKSAHYCLEPASCPWKSFFTPRQSGTGNNK